MNIENIHVKLYMIPFFKSNNDVDKIKKRIPKMCEIFSQVIITRDTCRAWNKQRYRTLKQFS